MYETNDIRIAKRQNEVRSMLLSSIDALSRRLADTDRHIDEYITSGEDKTMITCLQRYRLCQDTGDDTVETRTALFVLLQRADEHPGTLSARRTSLRTRVDALNNKLEQYEPIVYVAPVQVDRPPAVAAIPSPAEWADQQAQRRMERETLHGAQLMTDEQRWKFETELKRIADSGKVTRTEGKDCDRAGDPSFVFGTDTEYEREERF